VFKLKLGKLEHLSLVTITDWISHAPLPPPKHTHCLQHIALAINEEVGLQERLLDEMDEETDVIQSRMRAATIKVRPEA
jgi:hypothetical protein